MYGLNFLDPLKKFEKNKIVYKDFVNPEIYKVNPEFFQKKVSVKVGESCFQKMLELEASVYVFSEDELKELLKID